MEKTPTPLTPAELQAHPEYPHVIWALKPTKKEKLAVAAGRGGPFNITYEVHGHGPNKMVFIMGLGGLKSSWQRQAKDLGHTRADQYSCLIFDNRGIGESDKPLMRYSTSEMARDVLEIVDHLGWTGERELNVTGISMGGMISQEFASLVPNRIASLNLLSTAAQILNQVSFFENLRNRINMFIPKALDVQLEYSSKQVFSAAWLASPDKLEYVVKPFPTAGDRIRAGEMTKRLDTKSFTRLGFTAQAIAAGWHVKSAAQLGAIADAVGRERIWVLHGDDDKMIPFVHAGILADGLDMGAPPEGPKVERRWFKGVGHVIPIEKREEFLALLEEMVKRGNQANAKR